jgi:hypothetical protein
VNHRIFKWQASAALLLTVFAACTKIDTTQLGTDLIPAVDNINTFEAILPVVANNYIVDDSTRLNASDAHMVGGISTDPIFGKSSSTLFFEMKPASFPFLPHSKDSVTGANVGFDSAVLILNYLGHYGDSNNLVQLKLYEVNENLQRDTLLKPEYNIQAQSTSGQPLTINMAKVWGEKSMKPVQFKDTIQIRRGVRDTVYESVSNQLRIPLNPTFAKQLFEQDSTATGAFYNDSAFKSYLKGFALKAEGTPEALLYFSLASSKIQFYYRQNPGSAVQDTTSSTITFNSVCGHAVKFDRDRQGSEVNALASQTEDWTNGYDNIFIQATPGTAAKIRIKGIDTFKLTNRVIHRAELRVTQLNSAEQQQRIPPNALYLDINFNPTKNIYKGVPYDLSPYSVYYCYPADDINFSYFGGITRYEKPAPGKDSLATYHFNLTRYLQGVVTRGDDQYEFRLSAPFYNFYENCANGSSTNPQQVFPFSFSGTALNPLGRGRVKVAGGGAAVPQDIRMQLRVIYSKL